MSEWRNYQEEVAEFFRSLGLSATTDVTLTGTRTTHDIDVVVRSKHAGFDVLWLVECKLWKTAIPKEKVLALRSIVDDVGADRGFLMAESGYQSGALEASRYTNIMLTSINDLRETLAYELGIVKLQSIIDRVASCRDRYWRISKPDRIDLGLRPDVGAWGYMGDAVIKAVEYTVYEAFFHGFPVRYDRSTSALMAYAGGRTEDRPGWDDEGAIGSPSELYAILDAELRELEEKLDTAESVLEDGNSPSTNP